MFNHASSVIIFSGHMIDQPDRLTPRFPAYLETAVCHAMYSSMASATPAVAITSAACGGDLIFAEIVLEQGVPLVIVFPFHDREDFLNRSVRFAGDQWVTRFEKVCTQATTIAYAMRGSYQSDRDFEMCQHTLLTIGRDIATTRGLLLRGLALCDVQQLGTQLGGTHTFLQHCRNQDVPYDAIDLAHLRSKVCRDISPLKPRMTLNQELFYGHFQVTA